MNSETCPARNFANTIPTVAPWRPLLDTTPPPCRCPHPYVMGHEPECFLAPPWVRFRHGLFTEPVRAIGDQWAALAALALSLGAAELARPAGPFAFIITFVAMLVGLQLAGLYWQRRQQEARWDTAIAAGMGSDIIRAAERVANLMRDLRRGFTDTDRKSVLAKWRAAKTGDTIRVTHGEGMAIRSLSVDELYPDFVRQMEEKPVDHSTAAQ